MAGINLGLVDHNTVPEKFVDSDEMSYGTALRRLKMQVTGIRYDDKNHDWMVNLKYTDTDGKPQNKEYPIWQASGIIYAKILTSELCNTWQDVALEELS